MFSIRHLLLVACVLLLAPRFAHAQTAPVSEGGTIAPNGGEIRANFKLPTDPAGEPIPMPLSLEALEKMALQNNPTLGAAAANIDAARGRQIQGGLSPNPKIGYFAQDVGEEGSAGQHGGFISRELVAASKLQLNQAVAGQEIQEMQFRYSAQELRVLNDVRIRFYDALVAQRQVQLTTDLAKVSTQLADSTRQLLQAQQVSRSDSLQAEIEAQETQVTLANSKNQSIEAWRRLATVVGISGGEPQALSGTLEGELPTYDWNETLTRILSENQEIAAARARVDRNRLAIQRARREPIPNVEVMASVSYMDQTDDVVAGVQAGIPIPICDRNQGNIMSAEAELIAAQNNIRRLELQLQERLAETFRRYANARDQVARYRDEILPRAQQSFDLMGAGYREGQVDFLALLTAQRTYIRVNLAYLAALAELRQAATMIEGNLLTGSLQAE